MQHFRSAEYEQAARAFLRADALEPNSDALDNALVAAQRAGAHLLVTVIAERALGREHSDPGLVDAARRALAAAANHLAHVQLRCEPTPCQLTLDGERLEAGARFVMPGTHHFEAQGSAMHPGHAAQVSMLDAGTAYQVVLHVPKEATGVAGAEGGGSAGPQDSAATNPASRWVLYGGIGATAILTGLTTWSGIDALNTRHALGDSASAAENADLEGKITRTDVFLACTITTAVATVAWAIWGPRSVAAPLSSGSTGSDGSTKDSQAGQEPRLSFGAAPLRGGLLVGAEGTF